LFFQLMIVIEQLFILINLCLRWKPRFEIVQIILLIGMVLVIPILTRYVHLELIIVI
jgi:hypothetical protein